MQEFLSLYSKIENPTMPMIFLTFLLAFLCSSLIALIYYHTTPTTLRTANYIQALVLSSLIATMILQSIGDSVASGLGILGALTIINFRTSFRDPRDIIFMFASLGVGIACGSYVFFIAVVGTLGFSLIAFLLQFTPFHLVNHFIWEIKLRIENESQWQAAEKIMKHYCRQCTLEAIRNDIGKDSLPYHERDYVLIFFDDKKQIELLDKLKNEQINVRKFNKQNTYIVN